MGIAIERKNSVGMQMVLIPPGAFMMGSTQEQAKIGRRAADSRKNSSSDTDENAVGQEVPQHHVIIGRPFLLAATEVTVAQFTQFVEATEYVTDAEHSNAAGPKKGKNSVRATLDWRHPGRVETGDSPVTQVTWRDAVHFCNWLSEYEKRKPCYTKDANHNWILLAAGDGYVLPTEAEWEFACRAGTTTQFSFGDAAAHLEDYGWYGKNSSGRPRPVGLKRPNPFGLYDMHGNVMEWCHDWYGVDYYANSPPVNPFGPDSGSTRVARVEGLGPTHKRTPAARRLALSTGAATTIEDFASLASQCTSAVSRKNERTKPSECQRGRGPTPLSRYFPPRYSFSPRA